MLALLAFLAYAFTLFVGMVFILLHVDGKKPGQWLFTWLITPRVWRREGGDV